LADLGTHF